MKPLIGITTGEIDNVRDNWSPITYGQSHTYSDSIVRVGGIPVLIPIMSDDETLKQLYDKLDGILFAGGNDIDPALYGAVAQPETQHVSFKRDATEVKLMKWALSDQKPIFAICRGMQLLNAVEGGTLYQHIPTDLPNASDHDISSLRQNIGDIAHTLKVDTDSRLSKIINSTSLGASTYHHQAINTLGHGIKASAWSEDGVIEAVEMPSKAYVLGFQCHPESLQDVEPKWRLVFESFITSCAKK